LAIAIHAIQDHVGIRSGRRRIRSFQHIPEQDRRHRPSFRGSDRDLVFGSILVERGVVHGPLLAVGFETACLRDALKANGCGAFSPNLTLSFRRVELSNYLGRIPMQGKMLTYKWAINGPYQRQVGNIGLEKDTVVIRFHGGGFKRFRDRLTGFEDGVLELNKIDWLREKDGHWWVDLDKVRKEHDYVAEAGWLTGVECVKPAFVDDMYAVQFELRKEELTVNKQTRILLSHKGPDKPMVERYFRTLKILGFDPWYDKNDIKAGDTIHREIAEGFDKSCAVVFFVTPNFVDDRWLKMEIDHANEQIIRKADCFRIITLVMPKKGKPVTVPPILERTAHITVKSDLDGLAVILEALPIAVGPPTWRGHLGPNG
jgi:hypothetical protein